MSSKSNKESQYALAVKALGKVIDDNITGNAELNIKDGVILGLKVTTFVKLSVDENNTMS